MTETNRTEAPVSSDEHGAVDHQQVKQSNNPNHQQHELKTPDEAEMKRQAKHNKKWNRRLKIFFCCLGYKKNKVRL